MGQPSTSIIVTSQPYTGHFFYQPYQGQYQYGPVAQNLAYQHQPYSGYTYQIPAQPQYGMDNLGYPGGISIPTAQVIPSYLGYPPPGTRIVPQGYQFSQHDPNRRLPFIATLDLPDLSRLMNDPIYYLPFLPPMPNKFPSDIPKFEGKSR